MDSFLIIYLGAIVIGVMLYGMALWHGKHNK